MKTHIALSGGSSMEVCYGLVACGRKDAENHISPNEYDHRCATGRNMNICKACQKFADTHEWDGNNITEVRSYSKST